MAVATATATAIARTGSPMPQAILTQDVEQLGERGTVVDVSAGYLRNYLIPRKLAQPATKGALEAAQERRSAAERAERESKARAQENAALLGKTVLTIEQQAGDDGRLFGSVTAQDISDAIREARGIKVDKRKVHLEEPIRHIGTHMVVVEVDGRRDGDRQDDGRRAEVAPHHKSHLVRRAAEIRGASSLKAGQSGVGMPAQGADR